MLLGCKAFELGRREGVGLLPRMVGLPRRIKHRRLVSVP